MQIPQNEPLLDGNERKYILDCLESNQLSFGKYIKKFEQSMTEMTGAAYAVSVSSGTAALHLSFLGLGLGKDDEVIMPDFTLIADSNMALLCGIKPVFVDVDPLYYCIHWELIEKKITPKTKAILAVHMYGHPCPMDEILVLAKKYNLYVIEDACQAHGVEYKGKSVGNLGDVGVFSFYSTKTLTCGEGGMIVTNHKELAGKVNSLKNQGFDEKGRNYIHHSIGFNYRLTNLQAAIAAAQMEKLSFKVEKKRKIAAAYHYFLCNVNEIELPQQAKWAKSNFWNYFVIVKDISRNQRNSAMEWLMKHGIESRLPFQALHKQPVYQVPKESYYPDCMEQYPVSEYLSDHGICLPSGLGLTDNQIANISENIINFFREKDFCE